MKSNHLWPIAIGIQTFAVVYAFLSKGPSLLFFYALNIWAIIIGIRVILLEKDDD